MGRSRSQILVVDDQPAIRTLLAKTLISEGYRVDQAEDGRKALETARSNPPEVIISDWMMPRMDGAQLCSALRADATLKGVFFIMLTAKDTHDDMLVSLASGADDFLTKPWDTRELLARIRIGVRLIALQREVELKGKRETIARMAVTMAHEINNPLASLQTELQLLEGDEALSEPGRQGVENSLKFVKRIAEIVTKLRNLDPEAVTEYTSGVEMLAIDDR